MMVDQVVSSLQNDHQQQQINKLQSNYEYVISELRRLMEKNDQAEMTSDLVTESVQSVQRVDRAENL